jgi:hypothetical protein
VAAIAGISSPKLAAGLWNYYSVQHCQRIRWSWGLSVLPVIEYEYHYDGQTFKSSHWSPGNYISGRKAAAEAVVSRYPAGSGAEVYINPKHPVKSVLEFGPTFLSRMLITSGLVFFALALLPLAIK